MPETKKNLQLVTALLFVYKGIKIEQDDKKYALNANKLSKKVLLFLAFLKNVHRKELKFLDTIVTCFLDLVFLM